MSAIIHHTTERAMQALVSATLEGDREVGPPRSHIRYLVCERNPMLEQGLTIGLPARDDLMNQCIVHDAERIPIAVCS